MSLSRRHFFRNLGLGSAGLLSTPFIIGRGSEAMAFEAGALQPPDDGGFIRISSNENARGPGRKTMDALRNTITPRVGRGYPPDYTGDLVATIADIYGVGKDHVIVGTGSGPILEAATRAFCSAQKPLVTAAPTYGTADQTAHRIGAPVKMITVDKSMGLDTDAMAEAAKGAGMIFFCNPNNPTGTVHNAADTVDVGNRRDEIAGIVRRISSSDPRRDRVPKRVHRLLAGAARVLVRADSDEAAVIRRLQGTRLEGHGLATAADDERRGQQASAAQSQIMEEMPTGQ